MTTKPTAKASVGIRPSTKRKLVRVCRHRGWSQAEALERLVQHELAQIDTESTSNRLAIA